MYSKNINDWSFALYAENDEKFIILSETDNFMDDQLNDKNLPNEIKSAIESIIKLSDCEIMEAVWEYYSEMEEDDISEKLISLGLTKQTL